ncbi:MAG: sugar-binding domain-containing protein, partial [Candidatus Latescibacterota bacterium]
MNKRTLIILIFILAVLFIPACGEYPAAPITVTLDHWQFKQVDSLLWRDASVPGNIHADLLQHGLIPDPFYGDNEKEIQWVAAAGWEYRCPFRIPQRLLKRRRIEIVFHGLDTYASVSVNGRQFLSADNMFRTWVHDVTPIVRAGENILHIRFDPVGPVERRKQQQFGCELPGGSRVFTRKAGFHYGWDWGPEITTCGIWRPIELRAWRTARIKSLHIVQKELTDRTARMSARFEIESLQAGKPAALHIENFRKAIKLEQGIHAYELEFTIDHPQRWWPNGWGEPHLYELRGSLIAGRDTIDSIRERIGLRTIELVQRADSMGSSFYFEVNGHPLFIKGANYVPQDNLQNRVTLSRYQALIKAAAKAHMNMLRVWGGGIYEEDIFYNLCDEHGLLLWQDFMFACGMYPGDAAFMANVRQEAIDNVKRLRNHPSIALWCGNNESSEGWHRWGWQDTLSAERRSNVWRSYQELFQFLLPSVIDSLAPDGIYWETSPKYGRGDPRHQFEGDAHYWGVWHDAEPFEVLEEKVPRFMSEFGCQSLPDLRTIERFAGEAGRNIESAAMRSHQKHTRGYSLIDEYMRRDYNLPADFADYVYLSQVVQAEGITRGIEAQRRSRPYCMGTLFWQLNDCWPAVSWSGIDYYGYWKALHYAVKKAYRDIIVSVVDEGDALDIVIVSDRLAAIQADIHIYLMDFHGNELLHLRLDHTAEANS